MSFFHRSKTYWEDFLSDICTKADKELLLKELEERWGAPKELLSRVAIYCDRTDEEAKRALAHELYLFTKEG